MAIGDIERGQGVDRARQRCDRGLVANTQSSWRTPSSAVTSTSGFAEASAEQRVDRRRVRIGEHDRAGLRADRLDLAHPVVLLGRRRQLMLADAVPA